MISNPGLKLSNLIKICATRLEAEMLNISKEQARLEDYKARNPEKILQINSWQETINSRADNIEYLQEAITDAFPVLIQAEADRRFLKGREYEKNGTSKLVSWFKNDGHKEAERYYSIANQRLTDNI